MLSVLAICFASCQKVGPENTENPKDNEEEEGTELSGDDIIPFKDPNFLEALLSEGVDTNRDGQISVSEAINVKWLNLESSNISDISEIQYFTGLVDLFCSGNQLTVLDLSDCPALRSLHCMNNQLTALDLSNCLGLTKLDCQGNQLTSLDVSNCLGLTTLSCSDNQLAALDLSDCPALTSLHCENNQLTSLDLSNCLDLINLYCSDNQLAALV